MIKVVVGIKEVELTIITPMHLNTAKLEIKFLYIFFFFVVKDNYNEIFYLVRLQSFQLLTLHQMHFLTSITLQKHHSFTRIPYTVKINK